jgi:uroporphyrinogen-III decarboxylase
MGGGDMADNHGPMYSPAAFRELILPRLVKLVARCNELGLHYVWRTDGKLWPVTDMIFDEAGAPGYGEVDRDAGMKVGGLRERYPDLVVWGNMSSGFLRTRSRDECYQESMRILAESGGRGYFHGASNAVLPGTPPENVAAMTEACRDFAAG